MNQYDLVAERLAGAIKQQLFIEVEASGRHVHLSTEAVEALFGQGHQLTPAKDLSQPGQYACQERVTLTGLKGSLANVVVLGPVRPSTQVEISLTDALILGVKAPTRQSGDIKGSSEITLSTERASLQLPEGAIIAHRHIHMTPEDAYNFKVSDGDRVNIKVFGRRPIIFQDTIVRVSPRYETRMHIDYDEANACGFKAGTFGWIVKNMT